MSKLKKVLLMCTAYVLVAALAIGGTVAYLTSEDSDVNVMTLGNVSIAQHEYERVIDENGEYKTITVTKADGSTQESYELQEFTQAKPLYPAVGDPNGGYTSTYVRFEQLDDPAKVQGGQQMHTIKNAQDKLVLVENIGKTDAYVRTLIAFEAGSYNYDEWKSVIVKVNGNDGEPWKYTDIKAPINIDDNNYIVVEAVYTGYSYGNMRHNGGILPAGEWTYNNLAGVYMAPTATNEDVEAIDGNDNGTYDILVLSQAVQAAGFNDAKTALDTAFGKSSEKAAEWFGGTAIPNIATSAGALSDMLEIGGTVVMGTDIAASDPDDYSMYRASQYGTFEYFAQVKSNAVLDLNGKTLTVEGHSSDMYSSAYAINVAGADLTIKGEGTVKIIDPYKTNYYVANVLNGTLTIEGGKYIGTVQSGANGVLNINDGDFIGGFAAYIPGTINVSGGFFDMNETYGLSIPATGVLNISGGYFEHFAVQNNRGVISISGGTFDGFDPTNYLAEGYVANEVDGIWTVTAE